MTNTQTTPIIDRLGRGFFGIEEPDPGTVFPDRPEHDPWLAWRVALYEAKRGSFANMPALLRLYDPAGDPRFNDQLLVLIGEAGFGRCFVSICQELESPSNPIDYEVGMNLCHALSIRGLLADVPLMLQVYLRHAEVDDAEIIPVWINSLLSSIGGRFSEPRDFASLHDYEDAVMVCQQDLARSLGGEKVLVLGGERFGVVTLAERILELLRRPYFPPDLRRRFEAATGIDCTAFYRDRVLQPLAAADIVEGFLEGPDAVRFRSGVRYFFGHPVPD